MLTRGVPDGRGQLGDLRQVRFAGELYTAICPAGEVGDGLDFATAFEELDKAEKRSLPFSQDNIVDFGPSPQDFLGMEGRGVSAYDDRALEDGS
jgi:hypothetical protein